VRRRIRRLRLETHSWGRAHSAGSAGGAAAEIAEQVAELTRHHAGIRMRITRLDTLAVLTAILLAPGAAAQVRTEPSDTSSDPSAAPSEARRVKTIPIRGTDVSRQPVGFETGRIRRPIGFQIDRIRCAAASDLCAWNRIPDPWDGGFEAPRAPQ
jgi:hypothetical protein